MKIVSNSIDLKSAIGSLKITPLNSDDFYVLSSVIGPNDHVESTTTRKLSLDGGKSQQKITLKLTIKVETIDIDLNAGLMYVKGKTIREHEHVKQGSYHTLNISIGDTFSVYKENWCSYQVGKLKEATKEVPEICFVVFYEKECVISTVSSNNITIVSKHECKAKNYKLIANAMYNLKEKMKSFVVAGTSDVRLDFFKVLVKEHKDLEKKSIVLKLGPEYKNIPNAKVVSRLLTDKNFSRTFSDIQYVDDLREIDSFFLDIDKGSNENSCIGLAEVKEALEYAAIKTLFITDKLYRPSTEILQKEANRIKAKICVIPEIHDLGERLKSIGGIAGTLKFIYK
jgi:protein pelota